MTTRILSLIFALLLSPQSNSDKNTAKISGTVINQASGETIDGVHVRFKSSAGLVQTTRTDREGKFAIENLPSGSYEITLSRSGFTEPETSRGPRQLTFKAGDDLKGIRFELIPMAAVSGRLTDQNRQPLSPAIVVALKVDYLNGRRVLLPSLLLSKLLYVPFGPDPSSMEMTPELQAISTLVPQARASELGEYRIFGLDPGEYYLAIWQKGAENPTIDMPPIFYPGVTDPAAATPIQVRGNADLPGMNIQVPSIESYSARFKVSPPTTPPLDCSTRSTTIVSFILVQRTADLDVVHFANSRIAGRDTELGNDNVAPNRLHSIGNNEWETGKLAPGSYEIYHATCSLFGLVGRLTFDIANRDVDAGTITIPANASLRGRIRNTSGATVALDQVSLRLRPTDWRGLNPGMAPNPTPIGRKQVNSDGTFAFQGSWDSTNPEPFVFGMVAPGHYQIDVGGLPQDVYVASIRYNAQEVRDTGIDVNGDPTGELEIFLDAPGGTVNGVVRNSKGDVSPDAKVVLVSRRIENSVPISPTTNTDQYGAFSFDGIAPGAYTVFAWSSVPSGAYDNPRFLESFQTRGVKVQIEKGSTANIELRVISEN